LQTWRPVFFIKTVDLPAEMSEGFFIKKGEREMKKYHTLIAVNDTDDGRDVFEIVHGSSNIDDLYNHQSFVRGVTIIATAENGYPYIVQNSISDAISKWVSQKYPA
jgi:hypothetical protein